MIIDTILNALANMLAGVPTAVFTTLMYFVQALLSILVPSSSGLAALTMPVMAPLTDLMGVNPEACLLYTSQFCNVKVQTPREYERLHAAK